MNPYLALLRTNRDFRLLYTGQTISQLGDWFNSVAVFALLLDLTGSGLPRILHWGSDPGPLEPGELAALVADLVPGVAHNAIDEPLRLSLLPGQPDGWEGRPGLSGHRDGAAPFPR